MPTFTEALNRALAVYSEAPVDADKQGLVLHPSPPAVPKAEAKRLGISQQWTLLTHMQVGDSTDALDGISVRAASAWTAQAITPSMIWPDMFGSASGVGEATASIPLSPSRKSGRFRCSRSQGNAA